MDADEPRVDAAARAISVSVWVTSELNSSDSERPPQNALSSYSFAAALATPEVELQLRVLRGERAAWPRDATPAFERRLLESCFEAGLAPLLHYSLRSTTASDWPAGVRDPLGHAARMQAGTDMLQERELIAVLSALDVAGVPAILLKGAALAYTHYREPALRTRCDGDVLIRPADLGRARQVLERLGYERRNGVSGSLVSYEECHLKQDGAVHHVVDLHWQVNNRQVFANALGWDDAYARSVPVARLCPAARALCPTHALLLACMHRAAHRGVDGPEGDRLLWLYDIHLIANAMTAGEWQEFVQLCVAKRMRRIGIEAFASTRQAFGTAFPGGVIEALENDGANGNSRELSASYLDANRRRLFLTNLRALTTWRSRATLLRESLFPPATYVLAKYRSRTRWLLPWWYARRAAEGVWKASRS